MTAAPARGFPRIQPRPTRSAQPTTESSGLSHQDPDLAKEGADRGGGDGLHQWHTCGEGCTPATVDRRHLVTRETEEAPSSHRQGGPPPGPPHPHLPGPPPRVPRPCPRRAAAESPPPPSSVSSARAGAHLRRRRRGRGEEGARLWRLGLPPGRLGGDDAGGVSSEFSTRYGLFPSSILLFNVVCQFTSVRSYI